MLLRTNHIRCQRPGLSSSETTAIRQGSIAAETGHQLSIPKTSDGGAMPLATIIVALQAITSLCLL